MRRREARGSRSERVAARSVERHRSGPLGLPTGRAIVGGLLVALSVFGVIALRRSADAPSSRTWLIARHAVAPGTAIGADDLALAAMDLHDLTKSAAFDDPADVIGQIAVNGLGEGELVQRGSIARTAAAPGDERRVGLSLDPADALNGALVAGDRVDVVSVPSGEGAAEVIVHGAMVDGIGGESDDSLGSERAVRLPLVVATEDEARLLVDAHRRGEITLIGGATQRLGGAA